MPEPAKPAGACHRQSNVCLLVLLPALQVVVLGTGSQKQFGEQTGGSGMLITGATVHPGEQPYPNRPMMD